MSDSRRQFYAIAIIVCALGACASLSSQSYAQRLAATYTALTVANDTAAALLEAQHINVHQARTAQSTLAAARLAADYAKSVGLPLGEPELNEAVSALREAQRQLCATRASEPSCVFLASKMP